MELVKEILILILFILQFTVLIQLLYTGYVRHKEDKKFWAKQDEISEEFLKTAKAQSEILNEGVAACEQKNTNKE